MALKPCRLPSEIPFPRWPSSGRQVSTLNHPFVGVRPPQKYSQFSSVLLSPLIFPSFSALLFFHVPLQKQMNKTISSQAHCYNSDEVLASNLLIFKQKTRSCQRNTSQQCNSINHKHRPGEGEDKVFYFKVLF